MRAVGIKTLKNRLSEYLRHVQSGETVLVTDRDRVVAELVPPREGRASDVSDALLVEAVRAGLVRPALVVGQGPPPSAPVASLVEILGELAQDRADR